MTRYKEAGVDIDTADEFINEIKPLVKKTERSEVLSSLGHYAALFALSPQNYKNPVLVSSTDGVGTKLLVALALQKLDTVGIDLVAMSVNDILCLGAEPLFFLDYFATGRLEVASAKQILSGIAEGCRQAQCALVGGETAEMPALYRPPDFDLAGFAVGVVERDQIIDGSQIGIGDVVVGLASNGFHSNGYSLLRKIVADRKLDWNQPMGEDRTLGEALLKPTRIYVKTILHLRKNFRLEGIAHITGGGLTGNIPRILPKGCQVVLERDRWTIPPLFRRFQEWGSIPDAELWEVFNCGIGLVLIVPKEEAKDLIERANGLGEQAVALGTVVARHEGEAAIVIR